MSEIRSLTTARDEGIGLLTAALWASTILVAVAGWLLGSDEVWLAAGLTVLINVVPTWCCCVGRSDSAARTSFGIAVALHPAIYVFLFQGHAWQMDLHMSFFAALATLTVLYDRRPLLVAAGIIVVHHLILQAFAPGWAFVGGADLNRVLLHAGLVVLETVALSMLAVRLATIIPALEAASLRSEKLADAATASEERTRAALAERDIDYRLLAEHSNDMVVRIGLDGIRRYISPACQLLLGYAPEEMVGGAPVAAIHVEDRARVMEVCKSLLAGIDDPICAYRQQHRDGHYVWLEATYRLVRDGEGVPVEFVASVRDISRRQEAEHAASSAAARLHEGHRLLSMAAAIARVGHWRLDLIRNECTWSDEVCRIHGVAPGYSPALESAIEAYHVDDRQKVSDLVTRAVETGEDFDFTATLVLADGTTRRVASKGQVERAPDGQVIGLFGVIQDISAEAAAQNAIRQSEAKYRLLADNATDVVLRTSDDGFVVYISPSCVDLSGFTPDQLVGRHPGEFIHPDDIATVHAAHVALITDAQPAATVEYRLRHSDGDWRWLESHMKRWSSANDQDGGVISAIRGITARKELEAELVTARERAESAARIKADFLANMSHEIRTPMNGVLGFTELVLASDLDATQRHQVELIAESGRSMMRLLNDILDVAKIESGKMGIAAEPTDLRHIVRRCTDLMRPMVSAKGVVLSARVDRTIPERLVTDPMRLRQVILNLIGNAVKFTERGAVTVEASVEHDMLRIDVTDTGIGIPADRLEAIFEQFGQAGETTARLYGGSGLGLSISAELVHLMGGTITVRSVVDEGTTFSVNLPLVPATIETVVPCVEIVAQTPPPSANRGRRPRVLIAEDHDINQALIMAMAHRAGIEPVLVSNGAAAVAMVAEAVRAGLPFDMVLMDMQMPEMDGLEATRRLRAAGHGADTLPIVALTANAYADDIQACLSAGMQAHLAKPVQVKDLTTVLARCGVTAGPAPVASPKVSTKLVDRYRERKADTLRTLDELAAVDRPDNDAVMKLAELLHKVAGVAAMFGEAELGACAKKLEDDLLACPVDQHGSRVRAAAIAFQRAA